MEENIYKEKLRRFCEGLEMRDIDIMLELPSERLYSIGKSMTDRINQLLALMDIMDADIREGWEK